MMVQQRKLELARKLNNKNDIWFAKKTIQKETNTTNLWYNH